MDRKHPYLNCTEMRMYWKSEILKIIVIIIMYLTRLGTAWLSTTTVHIHQFSTLCLTIIAIFLNEHCTVQFKSGCIYDDNFLHLIIVSFLNQMKEQWELLGETVSDHASTLGNKMKFAFFYLNQYFKAVVQSQLVQ